MKRTVLTFVTLIGLSKAIPAIKKYRSKTRSKKEIGRAFAGVLK